MDCQAAKNLLRLLPADHCQCKNDMLCHLQAYCEAVVWVEKSARILPFDCSCCRLNIINLLVLSAH